MRTFRKSSKSSLLALFFLSLFTLFSGCGYRFVSESARGGYRSLTVPYIGGDEKGIYTNALIYALSSRTYFLYDDVAPDLSVSVCLRPPIDTNIGFLYATGKESKVVASNEARLTMIADVKVIECATGKLLKECQVVVASVDYDFESDFSHRSEDIFSLGQLKMYNQARESSEWGLAQKLAEKIVDSLSYYW